ncbi:hypothetical protein ACIBQ1_03315 [Nonomuraea sp. NPDC050153]|uniref:hypothetical protein n=1 Tax=Nonomuraea sp. NPDC050153 TaxID=3364359 RepID=UPI00379C5B64
MLHLLCQVCGQSAREEGRIWWVMAEPPGKDAIGELFTNTPSTCRSCIPAARRLCPRLWEWSRVNSVNAADPYGVVADVFKPLGRRLVSVADAVELRLEAYHDLEYALAKQLIVTLDGLQEWRLNDLGLRVA